MMLEACQHEEGGEGGHKRVKSGRFAAEQLKKVTHR